MEQALHNINLDRYENLKEYAKVGKDFLQKFLRTIEYRVTTCEAMVPAHFLTGEECPHEEKRIKKWMHYHNEFEELLDEQRFETNEFMKDILQDDLDKLHKKVLYYQDKYAYCCDHCTYVQLPAGISVPEQVVKYKQSSTIVSARLTKLQIKQLLLYHFLSIDSNGFLTYALETEIAEILGCHVRSVRMNNEFMEQLGLIVTSRTGLSPYSFNVFIPDFQNYKKEKEEGGKGYLYIKKNFFIELLTMENVNAIRHALFMLIKQDNDTVREIYGKKEKNEGTIVAIKEFKKVVPEYLRTKPRIINSINLVPEIFERTVDTNVIQFRLKEQFNSKRMRNSDLASYVNYFEDAMMKHLQVYGLIEKSVFQDLAQMSFEYGFERVKEAFEIMINLYFNDVKDREKARVFNIGGMVRTIIRKKIKKGAKIS